jgi:hypothetical protein
LCRRRGRGRTTDRGPGTKLGLEGDVVAEVGHALFDAANVALLFVRRIDVAAEIEILHRWRVGLEECEEKRLLCNFHGEGLGERG